MKKALDKKELRKFALVTGGVLAVLFGLFLPWALERPWPLWPWVVAGILVIWGMIVPSSLNPVYNLWMKFGHAVGWINSRIILGIMFVSIIIPVGLLWRMLVRDPLKMKCNESGSYRVVSKQPMNNYLERPY
ncbi:SxtJ family membrane protein [Alcanivorax sp.]|uniref:SxtJ family membrane protein n=1 Tax=Alcanivorax sp. TaxID=1872427 RepID=UPI0025872130|nr:SxtJ family membrane protein [Alcanivorax sp.]